MNSPADRSLLCDACGTPIAGYEAIHYGSEHQPYRDLCYPCFNAMVAEKFGLTNFDNPRLAPLDLTDARGKSHHFILQVHLFMPGVAVDAVEIREGEPKGYRFQIIGDPEDDILALSGRLVERLRRALAMTHIEKDKQFGWRIKDQVVRGQITWDENMDGRMPLAVIDGHEIPWEEVGRMLMSFEGFQFKLEIKDRSEEL